MYQLPPLPQQIGVYPQFFAQQTETIVLKERVLSLSGDSFDVVLAGSNRPLVKVAGSVLSLSGRKAVSDPATGQLLFHIRREHLHLHTTYALENAEGTKFCEIKSGFQLLGSKATITFTSSGTGRAETLVMKGNWLDSSADIVDGSGAVVARIDRKLLSGRDLLFGQQSYAVVVAPGADMALMAALCICLDEKNNEQ